MKKLLNAFWMMCLFVAATACMDGTDDKGNNDGSDNDNRICDAGSTKSCGCTDGRNGSQTCASDGDSYGSCMCTGPSPSGGSSNDGPTCIPGEQRNCTCSTGDAGTQTCRDDGKSYTPCQPNNGGDGDNACTPGASRSCGCSNGQNGAQVCKSDGSAYGSCSCTGGSDPGGGGSGGGGNITDGACGGDPVKSVSIDIRAGVDHIYCMGAEVAVGDHRMDTEADWIGYAQDDTRSFMWKGWTSFANDAFDGSYAVTVQYCNALRFQCYLKNPAGSVDKYHYLFADDSTGLRGDETAHISKTPTVVDNLHNGKNGQVN